MISLEEFHEDFFNQVRAAADAEGEFLEAAFLELYCDYLTDSGEFDTFDAAHHRAAKGMRVDGYAGDPLEGEGVLTLIISDFSPDPAIETLTRTDVDALFRRLSNFLKSSLTEGFKESLEEESEGYGLAELIWARRHQIARARLFLISNRSLSARVEGLEEGQVGVLPVSFNVWDITRLHRLVASGKGREDIEINLAADFGEEIPCLSASVGGSDYEAYLAAVPGGLLAKIYERYGARLLEQNVRCFLQARGNVNKGIRNTILNAPGMFFAYNNGVTATAEDVTVVSDLGGTRITGLKNFQIVNGGQTTASIFTALKRDKADLERIFVQMKLSVVDPAKSIEIVPKISEFANSQNRVNAADFFANHPFHVRMEEFSRRLWAPSVDGTFRQTKWFYERARGQYLDAKSLLKVSEKKRFELEFPKQQTFTKTDLAKFEMVWEFAPHIVSRGAQENFATYAKLIGQRWSKDSDAFNELYFRTAVARAIIFRTLEKDVIRQPWYDGGYRANIVAYSIAKLAKLAFDMKRSVDFEEVWKRQAVPESLRTELVRVAEAVQGVLTSPAAGMANVTQWAKRQGCWSQVEALEINLSHALAFLVEPSEAKASKRDAKKTQKTDGAISAQVLAVQVSPTGWERALTFARSRRLLTPKQHSIMAIAATPGRVPSDKQSVLLVEALTALEAEGYIRV
ncbi:MAG: AIPR protein [Mesorhizobium sp.]|uniref:AIPR family protein n=1 Tax=Mesorhizobium sp. TaxID=1871066 RepID=UPI000FE508FF|nr:AIPR family protein [Mesorhizobium sp.]RWO32342.1 MAG: AIPR protein [Mesorhizobium sp.]